MKRTKKNKNVLNQWENGNNTKQIRVYKNSASKDFNFRYVV